MADMDFMRAAFRDDFYTTEWGAGAVRFSVEKDILTVKHNPTEYGYEPRTLHFRLVPVRQDWVEID